MRATGFVASSGGGWITGADINLAALGNINLSVDGNHTFAGFTWKKENSAADASPMAIVSGQGLVVQPVAATDYTSGARTMPLLLLQLAQLGIKGLDWSTRLRFLARYSTNIVAGGSKQYDNVVLAYDSDSMVYSAASLSGVTPAGVGFSTKKTLNSTGTVSFYVPTVDTPTWSAQDVLALELDRGDCNIARTLTQTSVAGDFATSSRPWCHVTDPIGFRSDESSAPVSVGSMGVLLGALRAGSTNGLRVTFSRLRVDYQL